MSNFFIAVGGTGQNVALAYVRLLRLYGFTPSNVYLVDADSLGPITQALLSLLNVNAIPTIRPVPNLDNLGNFNTIFTNPICDNLTQPILKTLYTEDELYNIPIKQGMYGSPPVGATAIKTKINQTVANPGIDPTLAVLLNSLRNGQHRVTISGSVIGGTGAGGVPTIAKHIRDESAPTTKITIIDFVKWFLLQPADDNDAVTTAKDRTLQTNSESGVFYLKDKIATNMDACVLLGLPDQVPVPYQAVGHQEETIHFLNMIAAVIANNSFNAVNYTGSDMFPNRNSFYGYAILDGGERPSALKVFMPDGNIVTFDKIIMMAKAISKFLDYFVIYITGYPKGFFSFTPSLNVPNNLREAILGLSRKNNMSIEITVQSIIKKTKIEKEKNDSLIEWFNGLHSTNLFVFNDADVTLSTSKYKKAEHYPMIFFRKWFNEMNVQNWTGNLNHANTPEINTEIFVDRMIKGLRRSINKSYMNSCFNDMNWL